MFASCLALALSHEPDFHVLGTATTLAAAREALASDPPDVVLLDHRLPDGLGVDALPELQARAQSAKIVLLFAAVDDATLAAATEAGCAGLLVKSGSIEDLYHTVRAAAAGEVVISPDLLARLVSRVSRNNLPARGDLTPRELQVLELIAEGLPNAQIGARLGVSVNTVRNHVQNLLAKLGAHSKLEALALAVREGLIQPKTAPL